MGNLTESKLRKIVMYKPLSVNVLRNEREFLFNIQLCRGIHDMLRVIVLVHPENKQASQSMDFSLVYLLTVYIERECGPPDCCFLVHITQLEIPNFRRYLLWVVTESLWVRK